MKENIWQLFQNNNLTVYTETFLQNMRHAQKKDGTLRLFPLISQVENRQQAIGFSYSTMQKACHNTICNMDPWQIKYPVYSTDLRSWHFPLDPQPAQSIL
jgi:hypothetical protein